MIIKIKRTNNLKIIDEALKDYTFVDCGVTINDDKIYINNSSFFSNEDTFNSIIELGKTLFNILKIDNINSLDGLLIKSNYERINKIINEWLSYNPYPYKKEEIDIEDKLSFYIKFAKDSVFCYKIDRIRCWIRKSYQYMDEYYEIQEKRENLELDGKTNLPEYPNKDEVIVATKKLCSDLQFINFKDIILSINPAHYIINISEIENDYNFKYSLNDSLDYYAETDPEELMTYQDYHDSVRIHLISYLTNIIRNRNLFISQQQPYYIKGTNQFNIYNYTNSLINIVYNKLLIVLTSKLNNDNTTICHNPDCIEEIPKGHKYCNKKECKLYQNKIIKQKSRNKLKKVSQ